MRNQRSSKPEAIVPFLLRLPSTLHQRIKDVADAEDRSMQAEIRRVLLAHVTDYEEREAA